MILSRHLLSNNESGLNAEPHPSELVKSMEEFSVDTEQFIRQAFEKDVDTGVILLFRRYYARLCSHAVRFVSSKEIAEDIVSDIFLEFQLNNLHKVITTSFRSYLYTAVRNRAFDYVKAEMRRSSSLEYANDHSSSSTFSPDSITQYEELYHDVEIALKTIPIKRRQVYVMHRFEGKKYAEIAAELGISIRTVETLAFQATRQIRSLLQAKWLLSFFLFCLH